MSSVSCDLYNKCNARNFILDLKNDQACCTTLNYLKAYFSTLISVIPLKRTVHKHTCTCKFMLVLLV